MPATIVVPLFSRQTDLGGPTDRALRLGYRLARRTGATLCLLSVIETVEPGAATSHSAGLGFDWMIGQSWRLPSVAARFPNVRVRSMERVGDAATEVLNALQLLDDPMLVLPSHGGGGLSRLVLGSLTSRIIHGASCPVLVVRGDGDGDEALGKVLIPLDGSLASTEVLRRALPILGPSGLTLHLVQVIEPHHHDQLAARRRAAAYLQEIAAGLERQGQIVDWQVRVGGITREIIRAVERSGSSLIAMTTHGYGGFKRLVFGSVCERVLRESPVPVLLIHPHDSGAARWQPVDWTAETERVAAPDTDGVVSSL